MLSFALACQSTKLVVKSSGHKLEDYLYTNILKRIVPELQRVLIRFTVCIGLHQELQLLTILKKKKKV